MNNRRFPLYLVCSGGAKVARDHHLPDEVLALGQHCQCGEQPAVAQNAWNQEKHVVIIKGILSSPYCDEGALPG